MVEFTVFPREIKALIFGHLDLPSRLNCELVCTEWKEIIRSIPSLQISDLTIQITVVGFSFAPPPPNIMATFMPGNPKNDPRLFPVVGDPMVDILIEQRGAQSILHICTHEILLRIIKQAQPKTLKIRYADINAFWGGQILNEFLKFNSNQKNLYLEECRIRTETWTPGTVYPVCELTLESVHIDEHLPHLILRLNPKILKITDAILDTPGFFSETVLQTSRLNYLIFSFQVPQNISRCFLRITDFLYSKNQCCTVSFYGHDVSEDFYSFILPYFNKVNLFTLDFRKNGTRKQWNTNKNSPSNFITLRNFLYDWYLT